MSKTFILEPGETVLKRICEIGWGSGISRGKNDLILTDKALVLQRKNLFGKDTEALRFPLSDIAISNGQAQVRLGKKDSVTPVLDVYFRSGMESFCFRWEDEVKEWANEINTLLTGQPPIYRLNTWVEEMAGMAATLTGTVRDVKKALGIRSDVTVSAACPSCGASISGTEGETVCCPYCGSFHTFD